MIGVSIARSTRSGSGVGPGICRKWRPTAREEFFDISKVLVRHGYFEDRSARPAVPRLAAMKDDCGGQSSLLATRRSCSGGARLVGRPAAPCQVACWYAPRNVGERTTRAAAARLPTWQDSARLFAGAIETVG